MKLSQDQKEQIKSLLEVIAETGAFEYIENSSKTDDLVSEKQLKGWVKEIERIINS